MSGALSKLRTLLGHTLAPLGIRYYDLYYGQFSLGIPIAPVDGTATVSRAPADEIARLIRNGDDALRASFERALAIESECWIAKVDGAVAGYTWINRACFDIVGLPAWPLPPGVAYHYQSYVFPAFRGRKVFQSMIAVVYEKLREEGWEIVANFVDTRNAPSIRARKKFGTKLSRTRILKLPAMKPIWLERAFRENP